MLKGLDIYNLWCNGSGRGGAYGEFDFQNLSTLYIMEPDCVVRLSGCSMTLDANEGEDVGDDDE